jgi:hypothetical protein
MKYISEEVCQAENEQLLIASDFFVIRLLLPTYGILSFIHFDLTRGDDNLQEGIN